MPHWFFTISMTLFGFVFGSFANVVIWRLPRGESIVRPGSRCPACGTPIAWYDNVPVISWMALRASCRSCGVHISSRYPLVETASAALFVLAAMAYGVGVRAVAAAAVYWLLLVLSLIDIDHLRLPNPLVGLLAALGLALALVSQFTAWMVGPLTYGPDWSAALGPLATALLGAALGGVVPASIAMLYSALRGRSGLGMGDIKLLGALGLLLGPYVLMSMLIGSLIGMVFGLTSARSVRLSERRIPFGPWLAVGAVVTSIVGPEIWHWYLRLVGLA